MKPKILLVEDNAENRYLAQFLLEQGGFEVEASVTGSDGLARAATLQPAAILLDIQLPDIDGYEVARRLKLAPVTAQIPIIAVSSFAMPGEKLRATETGCAGYITKPIDPMTFVTEIKGLLNRV